VTTSQTTFLERAFVHYRSSVKGLIGAVLAFAILNPGYFHDHKIVLDIALFASTGGLGFLGLNKTDIEVSANTQPESPK
jgi:hypothetical protein